jgi:hypothetical protein
MHILIFIILLSQLMNILSNIWLSTELQQSLVLQHHQRQDLLVVAKLEEFIRNKLITTYSSRLANELRTFIWTNGKPQALKGYNDDLVMALAIACWVRDTALQTNQRDLNYKKAFVDAIITSRTSVLTQK